ncbi:MAG: hypothetical protein KDJ75_04175 [Alphaproteobacteria bacterium]|nr:hypothetical protein [Alphaproteobacteria bacterium]
MLGIPKDGLDEVLLAVKKDPEAVAFTEGTKLSIKLLDEWGLPEDRAEAVENCLKARLDKNPHFASETQKNGAAKTLTEYLEPVDRLGQKLTALEKERCRNLSPVFSVATFSVLMTWGFGTRRQLVEHDRQMQKAELTAEIREWNMAPDAFIQKQGFISECEAENFAAQVPERDAFVAELLERLKENPDHTGGVEWFFRSHPDPYGCANKKALEMIDASERKLDRINTKLEDTGISGGEMASLGLLFASALACAGIMWKNHQKTAPIRLELSDITVPRL